MFTEAEIAGIVRLIVSAVNPEEVILFGSYAKGVATFRSDLDLLVVLDTQLPLQRRKDLFQTIQNRYAINIDVHAYTRPEVITSMNEPYSFIRSVFSTGKILYRRF